MRFSGILGQLKIDTPDLELPALPQQLSIVPIREKDGFVVDTLKLEGSRT